MTLAVEIASWGFILLGSFFTIVGAFGLVRMPEVFTRMHAASVTDTLGVGFLILGMSLQAGFGLVTLKLLFLLALFVFTGPVVTHALAQGALALGFHLSFSGIVTFPNAEVVHTVAEGAPPDRILAETDSPFLSPVPFRGRPNEPARVRHVVEKLAALRGVSAEEMADATVANTRRCFGIGSAQSLS